VFERFPKTRGVRPWACGAFPGTMDEIEHGFFVRPDLVGSTTKPNRGKYLANNQEPARLLCRFARFNDSTRLMPVALNFGRVRVGYPFPLGERNRATSVESMKLSVKRRHACFRDRPRISRLDIVIRKAVVIFRAIWTFNASNASTILQRHSSCRIAHKSWKTGLNSDSSERHAGYPPCLSCADRSLDQFDGR